MDRTRARGGDVDGAVVTRAWADGRARTILGVALLVAVVLAWGWVLR